ncbi:hypothetical protein [Nocardia alni]|uniref:hypothetical protein n=1 Tax=Nocardia alni TaxID=2815723 RepID=UPI001C24C0F5|nr:hypothetical protein [Nocardia alni]
MRFGAGTRPGTPRRRANGLGEVVVPGGDIRVMRNVGGYSTVGFRTNPPIDRSRAAREPDQAVSDQELFERELAAIDQELAAAQRELAAEQEPEREPAAAGADSR